MKIYLNNLNMGLALSNLQQTLSIDFFRAIYNICLCFLVALMALTVFSSWHFIYLGETQNKIARFNLCQLEKQ